MEHYIEQRSLTMISSKLLNLIVNNEDRLAKRWCEEVRKTEYMKTYQHFSEDELIKRNKRFFEQLVKWLESEGSKGLIGATWFFYCFHEDNNPALCTGIMTIRQERPLLMAPGVHNE